VSDGYKEMAMSREHWDAKREAELATLKARLAEAERDAARYRWLRTRINWRDVQHSFATNRTAPPLTTNVREWTHVDVRILAHHPPLEHIDEYIDWQLRRLDSVAPQETQGHE